MKTFLALCVPVLLAVSFSFSFAGESDDPFSDSYESSENYVPKMVRVQVEYVEMSHVELTKLLFLAKPEIADTTDLRKNVQAMVEKNEAKVIDTQMVSVPTGQKATSESKHEFIYPTEYEGPSPEAALKKAIDYGSSFPSNPATPTAFETRNLGSSFEAEATVGEDNQVIDFRVSSEFLWHTGDVVWQEWEVENGKSLTVKMPDFYVVAVNGSGVCISGQYSLLSVVSPKGAKGEVDPDRKVMVFVKCDVMEVK